MNRFVVVYESKKKEGNDCIQAFTYATGELAFANGSIIELQDLYGHYVSDLADTVVKEMEEIKNETDQTVKSKVS